MLPPLDVDAILQRLASLPAPFRATVATDADGTLWATDVGDELFLALGRAADFRGEARDALLRRARAHLGALPGDDLSLARALMQRYAAGDISIGDMCELQAESVGGRSEAELLALYDEVAERVVATVRPAVRDLLTRLHARGMTVHVVSGSLGDAVAHCLRRAGIPFDTVAGATLARAGERVLPALAGEIPLFEGKVRALVAAGVWPSALGLGDGGWDVTFLCDVHLPVLVHPKAALVEAMGAHPRAVVLA